MKKKIITCIITAALIASVGATGAFAATRTRANGEVGANENRNCQNSACTFVDSDGDGVCDNRAQDGTGKRAGNGENFADADGDGVCDNRAQDGTGKRAGNGENFADADGDRVCDNRAQGGTGKRAGNGENFVDDDDDGICDNAGSGCGYRAGRSK